MLPVSPTNYATRKLTEQEHREVTDTLERLQAQTRNALLLTWAMVHDDNLRQLPAVVPDYSIGDFMVFDRKLHPEFKD